MTRLPPPDPEVPALLTLLGEDARPFAASAGEALGFQVEELTPAQIRYSPGRSVIVQYRSKISEADGRSATPMLVAASGLKIPEAPLKLTNDAGAEIAFWRFPQDPFLPGLAAAASKSRAAELLDRLGAPSETTSLRVRAYRASRRAVVEATGEAGSIFMKVLRPDRAEALQARHAHLAPHLPIPQSLGWSQRLGIVAMQALPGVTLRRRIESGELELPSPQALIGLLDALPPFDAKPTIPSHDRFGDHQRLIGTVLPESAEVLASIGRHREAAASDDPITTVHGDFHASQVLTDEGRIVGLVDVDTAGPGQRISDLATMVGQLSTLSLLAADPRAIEAYIAVLMDDFDSRVDPLVLRKRIAFVMVGLATGPFRVQTTAWPEDTLRRLDHALSWTNAAAAEIPAAP